MKLQETLKKAAAVAASILAGIGFLIAAFFFGKKKGSDEQKSLDTTEKKVQETVKKKELEIEKTDSAELVNNSVNASSHKRRKQELSEEFNRTADRLTENLLSR